MWVISENVGSIEGDEFRNEVTARELMVATDAQAEVVAGILQHVGSLLTPKQAHTFSIWLSTACELEVGRNQHLGLVKALLQGVFVLSGAARQPREISTSQNN